MKKSNASGFFNAKSAPEIDRFIELSMDIAVQIQSELDLKGWSQSRLAKELGKSESEISKWLSGMHNLTLKSIAKLETALHEKLIMTSREVSHIKPEIRYVTLKVYGGTNDPAKQYFNYSEPAMKGKVLKMKTA